MSESLIKIRLMKAEDFDAVVTIDQKVLNKSPRREYYEMKFEKLIKSRDYVPVSFVAEEEDGTVVGFVMGELYIGQYGIQEEATLDTIGVDPDYQNQGIGRRLLGEFVDHLRDLGVKKLYTLVNWNDSELIRFFSANQFSPSKTINLERSL